MIVANFFVNSYLISERGIILIRMTLKTIKMFQWAQNMIVMCFERHVV